MKSNLIAFSSRTTVASASAAGVDLGVLAPPSSTTARRVDRDVADRVARLLIVPLFTVMAVRFGIDFLETGRVTGLLLVVSEALVVVLTIFRRAPAIVDRSIHARVLTTTSLLGPPIVRPSSLLPLAPEAITVALSACGLLIVIAAKMYLGRSFGIMPANRGIVTSGLYRFVRHPIYMGYLITHVAFLAANPALWNIAILLVSDLALMARALREEKTLALDDEYRAYQTRVRWRVLPGVF